MSKVIIFFLAILVLASTAGLLDHLRHPKEPPGPLVHVRNEFEFTVHAPYSMAAPLFGPEGERTWTDGHWDPHFLYPQPAQDIEGAVFRVSHGHHSSTWVNTAFNLDQGQIQYVYFIADTLVTRIDLHLSQPDAMNTKVHVAYERTALSAAANERVREMGDHDRNSGPEWRADIDRYLATQRQK